MTQSLSTVAGCVQPNLPVQVIGFLLLIAMLGVIVLTFLALAAAGPLMKLVGAKVEAVITRILGVLLAVARISGETAPLLFTSLGNLNWSISLTRPMSSLPVTIYQYAGSAFEDWVQLAWVGALLITLGVLALNIVARVLLRPRR